MLQQNLNDRIAATKERLEREKAKRFREIDHEMSTQIHDVQDSYKQLAVLVPPIPPLIIAICVYVVRRRRERESVEASRLI